MEDTNNTNPWGWIIGILAILFVLGYILVGSGILEPQTYQECVEETTLGTLKKIDEPIPNPRETADAVLWAAKERCGSP